MVLPKVLTCLLPLAICMYELKQKLMKSGIDYKLSDEKLLEMKIRWTGKFH